MTLTMIINHVGDAHCQQELALQSRRRLDVTFADEICEVAETKTTNITDELNGSPKKSKVLLKKSREDGW